MTSRILALALALCSVASADTVFDYSFDGDASPFFGLTKIPGTVRGQITLPDGDGTFLPILVTIDSFPAGLGGVPNLNLTPTDWETQFGSFTVTGGAITGAEWFAQQGFDPTTYDQIRFNFFGSEHFNSLFFNGNTDAVANDGGFAGVTYSAAPEPASLALLGLGVLAVIRRRRKTLG